jgi:Ca2+-binding RTX toxin-like protein
MGSETRECRDERDFCRLIHFLVEMKHFVEKHPPMHDYDRLGGVDTIRFRADSGPADLSLTRVQNPDAGVNDLVISINGSNDQLTVKHHFFVNQQPGVAEYAIEQLEFADGTVWNSTAIQARVDSNNSNALTSGSDTIVGSAGDDIINALSGNDTASGSDGQDVIEGDSGSDRLFGNGGNDTLRGQDDDDSLSGGTGRDTLEGGAGTDQLFGGDGDDILDGGAGDDRLEGGSGGDAYRLGRGSGSDRVFDATSSGIEADHVFVASDVLPNEMTITRSGDDLLVGIEGTADQLRVERFFDNSSNGIHRIEQIRFADGTVWNEAQLLELARTIRGTDAHDGLWGTSDGDIFYGLDNRARSTGAASRLTPTMPVSSATAMSVRLTL